MPNREGFQAVAYYGGRVLLFGAVLVFVVMAFASITATDVLPLLTMAAVLVTFMAAIVALACAAHGITALMGWDDE